MPALEDTENPSLEDETPKSFRFVNLQGPLISPLCVGVFHRGAVIQEKKSMLFFMIFIIFKI
jgi:hypothetical protein